MAAVDLSAQGKWSLSPLVVLWAGTCLIIPRVMAAGLSHFAGGCFSFPGATSVSRNDFTRRWNNSGRHVAQLWTLVNASLVDKATRRSMTSPWLTAVPAIVRPNGEKNGWSKGDLSKKSVREVTDVALRLIHEELLRAGPLSIGHPGNQLVAWIQHAVTYLNLIKQNRGRKTCVFSGKARGGLVWRMTSAYGEADFVLASVCRFVLLRFCFSAFAKDLHSFRQTSRLGGFSLKSVHGTCGSTSSCHITAARSKDFLPALSDYTIRRQKQSQLICYPAADPSSSSSCAFVLFVFWATPGCQWDCSKRWVG